MAGIPTSEQEAAAPMSTALTVTAQWSRWLPPCGAFLPAETDQLEARVTPKLVHVTFPRGYVQRLKRFDHAGRELRKWRVWAERTRDGGREYFVDIELPAEATDVG